MNLEESLKNPTKSQSIQRESHQDRKSKPMQDRSCEFIERNFCILWRHLSTSSWRIPKNPKDSWIYSWKILHNNPAGSILRIYCILWRHLSTLSWRILKNPEESQWILKNPSWWSCRIDTANLLNFTAAFIKPPLELNATAIQKKIPSTECSRSLLRSWFAIELIEWYQGHIE